MALVAACLLPASAALAAHPLTKAEARVIVARLYEALNEPMKKDVPALLARATNPDYRSCSTETDCLDRDALAVQFRAFGKIIPNLLWKINAEEDFRRRASGLAEHHDPIAGNPQVLYHVENWVAAIREVKGE